MITISEPYRQQGCGVGCPGGWPYGQLIALVEVARRMVKQTNNNAMRLDSIREENDYGFPSWDKSHASHFACLVHSRQIYCPTPRLSSRKMNLLCIYASWESPYICAICASNSGSCNGEKALHILDLWIADLMHFNLSFRELSSSKTGDARRLGTELPGCYNADYRAPYA